MRARRRRSRYAFHGYMRSDDVIRQLRRLFADVEAPRLRVPPRARLRARLRCAQRAAFTARHAASVICYATRYARRNAARH